jgi:hypothetical protein
MPADDFPTFGDLVVVYARMVVWDHVAMWGGEPEVLRDLTAIQFLPQSDTVELLLATATGDDAMFTDEADWAARWFATLRDLYLALHPEVSPGGVVTMLASRVNPYDETDDETF